MELIDAHPEALLDLRDAEHPIAHGVPHDRPFADELHQILVRSDDHHLEIVFGGALDCARDQVVRLHAVLLEDRDVESAHDLLAARHLLLQIRGRWRAVGFISVVDLFAKGDAPRVHGDREQCRPTLAYQALQHADRAVHRVRRLTRRTRERCDCVIGAEHIATEIDDVQDVGCCRWKELRHGRGLSPTWRAPPAR